MKWLRRLYLRIIPHYRAIDRMEFDLSHALELVALNHLVPESQRWYPAGGGWSWIGPPPSRVMMERFERIWECTQT